MSTTIRTSEQLATFAANGTLSPSSTTVVLKRVDGLEPMLANLSAASAWAEDVAVAADLELCLTSRDRVIVAFEGLQFADFARRVRPAKLFPLSTSAPMLEHAHAELDQLFNCMHTIGGAYVFLRPLDVLAPGPDDAVATGAHTANVLQRVVPNLQRLSLTRALEEGAGVAVNLALFAPLAKRDVLRTALRNLYFETIGTAYIRSSRRKRIALPTTTSKAARRFTGS